MFVELKQGYVKIDHVIDGVAQHFQITRERLVECRGLGRPRRVAMHLACILTSRSPAQIGAVLGGIDGTTVQLGKCRIERDMEQDVALLAEIVGLQFGLLKRCVAHRIRFKRYM